MPHVKSTSKILKLYPVLIQGVLCVGGRLGWLQIGRIFLFERTEVEPFDRIAGIEWNAVEFYRICCMARSLRSLRQVATLRHGHMARRSASLRSCIQGTRSM